MSRRFGRVTTVLLLAAAVAACADSPTSPASSSPTHSLATVLAAPPSSCGSVLGPSTFTRATGAPVAERIAFAAAQPGDWYQLVVTGGDAAGVTMRLALNGQSLLTAGDQLGARFELPVTLTAENVLELRLTGRPGTGVALSIVDARPVASVRIVPAILQGTAYLVAGATQDFGAEVRDAEGRSISTRCVTWRTTTPTVATVDADGVVHALAAGTTQLVAEAGGVEASVPLTVLESAGATTTRFTPEPCAGYYELSGRFVNHGCFAAEVTATPVAGGQQTLITVRLRDRTPYSVHYTMVGFALLDVTGAAFTPVSGLSVAAVNVVTTRVFTIHTTTRTLGTKTYAGWQIYLAGGFHDWVTFSFLVEGTNRDANSLFLNVEFTNDGPSACANISDPSNPTLRSCVPVILNPPWY